MNVKVKDLMVPQVLVTTPHKTLGHVKAMMRKNDVRVIPVVDTEGAPVGIVSASDLLDDLSEETPVSRVMSEKVYSVPQYDDVSVAARVMRNHRIHHVVVTHEHKVAGILSSFDMMKLVEDHRFTMKNAPTGSARKGSRRQ